MFTCLCTGFHASTWNKRKISNCYCSLLIHKTISLKNNNSVPSPRLCIHISYCILRIAIIPFLVRMPGSGTDAVNITKLLTSKSNIMLYRSLSGIADYFPQSCEKNTQCIRWFWFKHIKDARKCIMCRSSDIMCRRKSSDNADKVICCLKANSELNTSFVSSWFFTPTVSSTQNMAMFGRFLQVLPQQTKMKVNRMCFDLLQPLTTRIFPT